MCMCVSVCSEWGRKKKGWRKALDFSFASERHPHSMMIPPQCFTVGMVLCSLRTVPAFLLSEMTLGIEVHQTREYCCLVAFLQISERWSVAVMVVLLKVSLFSTLKLNQSKAAGSWSPWSLTKALFPCVRAKCNDCSCPLDGGVHQSCRCSHLLISHDI